jgi:hypothetical protein
MRNMREKWRRDWSEFDPSRIFAKDSSRVVPNGGGKEKRD